MTPVIGKGFTVHYDAADATTFANKIGAKIRDLSVHDVECDDVDVTGSEDSYLDFLAGHAEEKPRTLQLLMDKTELATIYSFFRVVKNWKITSSGGSTWVGHGYIRKISAPIPYRNSAILVTIEIRPCTTATDTSAAWTFTATP